MYCNIYCIEKEDYHSQSIKIIKRHFSYSIHKNNKEAFFILIYFAENLKIDMTIYRPAAYFHPLILGFLFLKFSSMALCYIASEICSNVEIPLQKIDKLDKLDKFYKTN